MPMVSDSLSSLTSLAYKYGTDKLVHGYLPHYDLRFQSLADAPIRLLEIGIYQGASLRMWRDYFHNGQIFGIDHWIPAIFTDTRIESLHGSQQNPGFMQEVVKQLCNLHIVIDDCSHNPEDQLVSFKFLWPIVESNGWYCIEDCFTYFEEEFAKPTDRRILDYLSDRWKEIFTAQSDIREIHMIVDGPQDALIFLRKR